MKIFIFILFLSFAIHFNIYAAERVGGIFAHQDELLIQVGGIFGVDKTKMNNFTDQFKLINFSEPTSPRMASTYTFLIPNDIEVVKNFLKEIGEFKNSNPSISWPQILDLTKLGKNIITQDLIIMADSFKKEVADPKLENASTELLRRGHLIKRYQNVLLVTLIGTQDQIRNTIEALNQINLSAVPRQTLPLPQSPDVVNESIRAASVLTCDKYFRMTI